MQPSQPRPTVAVGAIALGAAMFGVEISSVPVALPAIGRAFGSSVTALQWVVTAYTLASVTVLVAAGAVADRVGRRRVLTIAVSAFGAASLVCGVAPGPGVLVAGRVAQGMCGGALMICGLAALSHQFPAGGDRARAFGMWGIGFGGGLGLGPVIGLGLIDVGGWRAVFLVHGPLAVVAAGLSRYGVAESREPSVHRLDVSGIAALAVASVSAVYAISQGPSLGWESPGVLAAAGVAVLGVATLVVVERRADEPVLPASFFRSRPFVGALLGAVGMNISFWPLIVYVPLYLEQGLGHSTPVAAALLLGFTLPTFALPPLAERLALRVGSQRMIPIGLGVIGAGMLGLYLAAAVSHPAWWDVLPGAFVAGAGIGLTNTPVTNTTTGSVPPSRAGAASGVDLTARFTFLSLGVAVMGALTASGGPSAGFAGAALVGAVGVLALAAASRLAFGRARA